MLEKYFGYNHIPGFEEDVGRRGEIKGNFVLPILVNTGIHSINSLHDGKLRRISGNKRANLDVVDSVGCDLTSSAGLGRYVECGPHSSPL